MVKREFSEYEEISDDGSDSSSDSDCPPPRSRIKLEHEPGSSPNQVSGSIKLPGSPKIKQEPDPEQVIKDLHLHNTQAPAVKKAPSKNPCARCGEKGHIIQHCSKTSCTHCGAEDHNQRTCPVRKFAQKKTVCEWCNNVGHTSSKCSSKKNCAGCGGRGHVRKTCPLNPTPCAFCRKPGHKGKACPFAEIARDVRTFYYVDGATQTAEAWSMV